MKSLFFSFGILCMWHSTQKELKESETSRPVSKDMNEKDIHFFFEVFLLSAVVYGETRASDELKT